MITKQNRNYYLEVQGDNGQTIAIQPPLTMEFSLDRAAHGGANQASIRVYNLSKQHRNSIRRDQNDHDSFREITLQAGYGTQMPVVLKGNVFRAWSAREGSNYITNIDAMDFGFAFVNGFTDAAYPGGTDQKAVVTDMMKQLKNFNVTVGRVGSDYDGVKTARGNSHSGNTCDLLTEITGNTFYIENGVANVLGNTECTDDQVYLINAQTGLLGTPLLESTIVHVDILFEPYIKLMQRVQIESATESRFNGTYKVTGIHHRGIISEAVGGEAVTTLELLSGTYTGVAAGGI